jgi:hypothetical protein
MYARPSHKVVLGVCVGNWQFWMSQVSSSGARIPDGRLYKGSRIRLVSLRVCSGPQPSRLFLSYTTAGKFRHPPTLQSTRMYIHMPNRFSNPNQLSTVSVTIVFPNVGLRLGRTRYSVTSVHELIGNLRGTGSTPNEICFARSMRAVLEGVEVKAIVDIYIGSLAKRWASRVNGNFSAIQRLQGHVTKTWMGY